MALRTLLVASATLAAGLSAAMAQTPAPAAAPAPTVVTGTLTGNDGRTLGTATATGTDRVTIVRILLTPGAVPAGWHGIHFHAVADCSDTEKFLASKAHVNHGGKAHGLLNPNGPDEGDLPNVFAFTDGSVSAEVTSPVGLTGANGLLDPDGFALVIHANADDHTTQPIGGAGARIACAAFKR